MAVKKTYTSLAQLPGHVVSKCSAILHNSMQCWRAGDVLCEIEHEVVKEGGEIEKRVQSLQFCHAHARLEQAKDELEHNMAEEDAAKATEKQEPVAASKPVLEPKSAPVAPKSTTTGTAQIKK